MTATVTADTMRDRFAQVTSGLLAESPRLAVVLAEIGLTGFARATRRHPDRVINVGIREQLMISVASGLALTGLRPIAHSYTPFLIERPLARIHRSAPGPTAEGLMRRDPGRDVGGEPL